MSIESIYVNEMRRKNCPICHSNNTFEDDESHRYGCANCTFIWRKRD